MTIKINLTYTQQLVDRFILFISSLKILSLVSVVVIAVIAIDYDTPSVTSAFLQTSLRSASTKVEGGKWTPETPVNLGWNTRLDLDSPDQQPLDIICGRIVNGNDLASQPATHAWLAVKGRDIVYQREVTTPESTIYDYSNNNYNNFTSLDNDEIIDGLWLTRVRSFTDVNHNGTYEENEDYASQWSNYCGLTIDSIGPELSFDESLANKLILSSDNTFEVNGFISDKNLASYRVTIAESSLDGSENDAEIVNSIVESVKSSSSMQMLYKWDVSTVSGYYKIKILAEDRLGNTSSIEQMVLVDTPTIIEELVATESGNLEDTTSHILNPSFEQNFRNWITTGDVQLIEGKDEGVIPQLESKMVKFTSSQEVNALEQTINLKDLEDYSIDFWFNSVTDQNLDANQVIFKIYLDDKVVHEVSIKDIEALEVDQVLGNWRHVAIDVRNNDSLEELLEESLLKFEIQETSGGTAIYLDNITITALEPVEVIILEEKIELSQEEPYAAKVSIINADKYDVAEFQLTYTHIFEELEVMEAILGKIELDGSMLVEKNDIYFGTCSTGGECFPHEGVVPSSINLEAMLKGTDIEDKILQVKLLEEWL